MFKRIAIVLAMTMLVGCSTNSEKNIASLLKEKYNKDFCVELTRPGDGYKTALCFEYDNPDIRFEATLDNKTKLLRDDYALKCLDAHIAEEIGSDITDMDGNYAIKVTGSTDIQFDSDPGITLEKYNSILKDKNLYNTRWTKIVCCLSTKEFTEDDFYNVAETCLDKRDIGSGTISIYLVSPSDIQEIKDLMRTTYRLNDSFDYVVMSAPKVQVLFEDNKLKYDENTIKDLISTDGYFHEP